MREKGYQVIKGRGIAFIDDKKVKVKGSELNYSLQRIERVLETNRFIYLKKLPERLNGQPDSSPTISKLVNKHQVPKPDDGLVHGRLNQIENSLVDELVKDLSVTVTQLHG
jgi:hypothetical protein